MDTRQCSVGRNWEHAPGLLHFLWAYSKRHLHKNSVAYLCYRPSWTSCQETDFPMASSVINIAKRRQTLVGPYYPLL